MFLLAVTVALASCAAPGSTPTSGARDGSSAAKAIIVPRSGEITGIAYEYEYIRSHYPGAQLVGPQALIVEPAGKHWKHYDAITIRTPDRKEHTLYFDLEGSFGHLP